EDALLLAHQEWDRRDRYGACARYVRMCRGSRRTVRSGARCGSANERAEEQRLPERLVLSHLDHPACSAVVGSTRAAPRAGADRQAEEREADALADHQLRDVSRAGAECDAYAQLVPALGNAIGDDAVEA